MVYGGRVQSCKFFRSKLLSITDVDQLRSFIKSFDKESKELKEQVLTIMWHMRGSISREEAWSLSFEEREMIIKQIEERIKTVEKSGLALL